MIRLVFVLGLLIAAPAWGYDFFDKIAPPASEVIDSVFKDFKTYQRRMGDRFTILPSEGGFKFVNVDRCNTGEIVVRFDHRIENEKFIDVLSFYCGGSAINIQFTRMGEDIKLLTDEELWKFKLGDFSKLSYLEITTDWNQHFMTYTKTEANISIIATSSTFGDDTRLEMQELHQEGIVERLYSFRWDDGNKMERRAVKYKDGEADVENTYSFSRSWSDSESVNSNVFSQDLDNGYFGSIKYFNAINPPLQGVEFMPWL